MSQKKLRDFMKKTTNNDKSKSSVSNNDKIIIVSNNDKSKFSVVTLGYKVTYGLIFQFAHIFYNF